MYPIKLKPILKERLWGGTKLKTLFNKPVESGITGENWEVSGVPGDILVVANGALEGKNLQEPIDLYPNELLSKHAHERFGRDFPILIKFIDAREDLSMQVHPNDKLAKERHNSFGKTEMWYVLHADADVELIVDFNKTVSKKEYQQRLDKGTLTSILDYERVRDGDTFFINTGKVHAIGKGIIIAEIQQTSDITYRVCDFNRRDKNGNLCELHTELALDAIDYEKKDDFKVKYANTTNEVNKVVNCPYLITNLLPLIVGFKKSLAQDDPFHIYMCIKREGIIGDGTTELSIRRGETVFLPVSYNKLEVRTKGMDLLEVFV